MNASIADKVSFSVLKDHDSLSQVLDVINSAYKVSESFFRNSDHIDRISREAVIETVAKGETQQQVYLVGRLTEEVVIDGVTYPINEPVSVVCIEWKNILKNAASGDVVVELQHADFELSATNDARASPAIAALAAATVLPEVVLSVQAYLGQVSVDPRLMRRGLGSRLLAAAEAFIASKAQTHGAALREMGLQVTVEAIASMRVLNIRTDVLKWYPKHGYNIVQSGLEFDAPEIAKDEFEGKITVNILEKRIL